MKRERYAEYNRKPQHAIGQSARSTPLQPLYTGPIQRELPLAPRVAVIFRDRERKDGFVNVYQVGPGERIPGHQVAPGLWMTHSGSAGARQLPCSLAELHFGHEDTERAPDGAVVLVPRADRPTRRRAA